MGKMRNAYKILVEIPKGTRSLGRCRLRWQDNIRMDLRETGWEGVDWIHLAQYNDQWRVLVEHCNKPSVSMKGGEFLD
jgi:hypothetical protein